VHLEVELAVPAVEGQPGLLRRQLPRALDGRQVLRQHDAAFQLAPPRVAAARQVDRAALAPEPLPMLPRRGERVVERGWPGISGRCGRRERRHELERLPTSRFDDELVAPALDQRAGRSPRGRHRVDVFIQAPREPGRPRSREMHDGLVRLGP